MSVSGLSTGSEEVCNPRDTINSTIIQQIITEIQRSFTRNRKVRIKLLNRIKVYFFKISEMLEKDVSVQNLVIEQIEDIQNVILETTKLCICLSGPATKIQEVYGTVYDMGSYLETIIIGIYTWCVSNGKLVGKVLRKFLNALIQVSCDNPDNWLYYVMIGPLVLHILNTMFEDDHADCRSKWALKSTELIKQMTKAVFQCGDFGCQHYLLTVLHGWTQWIHAGKALPMINSIFSCVDPAARKELFMAEEPTQRIRSFLNSFNLSSRGPRCVIPILCNYFFIGEYKLNSEAEFCVDFSVGSGRLHTFYSIPGAPFLSLSIRKDQIHSICLNWVVNNGDLTSQETQSQLETQPTMSTFMKNEKVLFFHIVLNTDFEDISRDIENLIGKQCRSVYLVFRNGELVEKIMKEMNYSQHACGSMNCQRPRLLRRMLVNENKLTYTQSWCPESQVFGLDKSLLEDKENLPPKKVRSSSPNENISLMLRSPPTPGLSEICGPPQGIINATIMDFYEEFDQESLSVTYTETTLEKSMEQDSLYEEVDQENNPAVIQRTETMLEKSMEQDSLFDEDLVNSQTLIQNNETTLEKSMEQDSLYEEVDQENSPTVIQKAETTLEMSMEQDSLFDEDLVNSQILIQNNETTLEKSMEQDSSYEEVDQENSPTVTQKTDTALEKSMEQDSSYEEVYQENSPSVIQNTQTTLEIFMKRVFSYEEDPINSPSVIPNTQTTLEKSIEQGSPYEEEDLMNSPTIIPNTQTTVEKSMEQDSSFEEFEVNSLSVTQTTETTLQKSIGQDSAIEEIDPENCPTVIQKTKSTLENSMEEDVSYNKIRIPTLSPVVGFSKRLVRKPKVRFEIESDQTSTDSNCSENVACPPCPAKLPCYSHAYKLRLDSLKEKSRDPNYDPYDLMTCSDDMI